MRLTQNQIGVLMGLAVQYASRDMKPNDGCVDVREDSTSRDGKGITVAVVNGEGYANGHIFAVSSAGDVD